MKLFVSALVLFVSISASAAVVDLGVDVDESGFGVGNGGDLIRAYYLDRGKVMLNFLKKVREGKSFTQDYRLDLKEFDGCLSIDKVTVVEGPLYDNTKSRVDAIGIPGHVSLDIDVLTKWLNKRTPLDILVFHETLRCMGVNDDNYIVSRPFIFFFKKHTMEMSVEDMYAEDGGLQEIVTEEILESSSKELARDPIIEFSDTYQLYVVDSSDASILDTNLCKQVLRNEKMSESSVKYFCAENSSYAFISCFKNNLLRATKNSYASAEACLEMLESFIEYQISYNLKLKHEDIKLMLKNSALSESEVVKLNIVLGDKEVLSSRRINLNKDQNISEDMKLRVELPMSELHNMQLSIYLQELDHGRRFSSPSRVLIFKGQVRNIKDFEDDLIALNFKVSLPESKYISIQNILASSQFTP